MSFKQWLSESEARTGLGIYPPGYNSIEYPPLYFAPYSAGHLNAFANLHGDDHKELLSKNIKKQWEKNKKINFKGQPQVKEDEDQTLD